MGTETMAFGKRRVIKSKLHDGKAMVLKQAIINCMRQGVIIELIDFTPEQFEYFLSKI